MNTRLRFLNHFWCNPTNSVVATVSEWLFNDPASPWGKLPWQRSTFHDPLDSDLVKLPAFRKLLAREMENQVVVGSMQWQSGIGINIRYNLPQSSGGYHFDWPDEESPTQSERKLVFVAATGLLGNWQSQNRFHFSIHLKQSKAG